MRKRLFLFLSIYFLFVFVLFCYLPHIESFVHVFVFMAIVYGISFILLIAACLAVEFAACIALELLKVLGYDEHADYIKSVRISDALFPALAVIIMIAIPAWILHCI